jgi:hypothetical protein
MGRSTAVGPPWMTQSRAYFFAGSKSAGLTSTPSITVPSLLFQEMTSRVPRTNPATWSVIRVSVRGAHGRPETATSPRVAPEWVRKATLLPSLENENIPKMAPSGALTRSMRRVCGSSRKRWEAVFCKAENQMPPEFQATAEGFSSKASVSERTGPPSAGTRASRELRAK